MKNKYLLFILPLLFLLCFSADGQNLVINDPTKDEKPLLASAAEENLLKKSVLPKARKYWAGNDVCTEEFQIAGTAKGAFSKPNANQTLIFYQFCQTGNGLGNNGLALIENGKVLASYVSEGGWALNLKSLPDINQNGLNEFLVYYSGGMHQGQGGTGVDIMEFANGAVKGLGWFQSEGFTEDDSFGYKVSVKPGKTPLFYREKYDSVSETKWRKFGKIAAFKLGKTYGKFAVLK